jgi:hypothetical protein
MIRRRSQRPPEIGQEICSLISCIYVGTGISPLCLFTYAARREGLRYPWRPAHQH